MNMTSRVFGLLFLSFAAACSDDPEPGSPGGQAGQAAAGSSGQGGAGSSQGGAGSGGQAGSAQAGGGQAGAAGLAGSSGSSGQAGSAGSTGGAAGEAGQGGSSGSSGQSGAAGAAAGTGGTDAGGAAGSAAGAGGSTAGAAGEAGQGGAAGSSAGTAGAAGATAGAAGAAGGAGASSGSSKGSGGLVCTPDKIPLDDKHQYCPGTAGGANFKFVLPADAETNKAPMKLALYLHGDGGGAYLKDKSAADMYNIFASWLEANHAIFVPVLALNKCSWWVDPSYTKCDINDTEVGNHPDTKQENAAALDAVLKTLRGAYDISDAPVYYYGSSGGSIFLSGSFLPLHGDKYPGVFALTCGGSKPLTPFAWDTKNALLRAPTSLHFYYGAADEKLIPGLSMVPSFFSGLSFVVEDHPVPNQTTHCRFDGGIQSHQQALQIWQASTATP